MSIVVDAISSSGKFDNVASKTWAHTVGTGVGRILLVLVSHRDYDNNESIDVTSVTYAGTNLTKSIDVKGANGSSSDIWYLKNPSTGANNVVVNFSPNSDYGACGAVSFLGSGGVFATASNNSNTTNISVSLQTPTGGFVVDCVHGESGSGLTMNGSQTQIFKTLDDQPDYNAGSYKSGIGDVSMDWTVAEEYWTIAAVSLAPLKGGSFIFNLI